MKPRDIEGLYKQYSGLRNKLLRQEKARFAYKDPVTGKFVYDKAKVNDLKSYIDYQFVLLVKEYDPNSPVDFPNYIKTKLTLRTKHSYIKRYFSHYYITHDMHNDNNKVIEEKLHKDSIDSWEFEQDSPLAVAISKLDLTDMERDIIAYWSQPPEAQLSTITTPAYNSDRTVCQLIKNKYPKYNKQDITSIMNELKVKLRATLGN
jgi:hypothetical protein